MKVDEEAEDTTKQPPNPVVSLPIDGDVPSKKVSSSVGKDFSPIEYCAVLRKFRSSGRKYSEVGMPGFTLTYQPTESDVNIPPEAIRKRTNRVRSEMGTKAQHDLEPAHEYPLPLHLQHLSNCYRTLLANRCTLVAQYGSSNERIGPDVYPNPSRPFLTTPYHRNDVHLVNAEELNLMMVRVSMLGVET